MFKEFSKFVIILLSTCVINAHSDTVLIISDNKDNLDLIKFYIKKGNEVFATCNKNTSINNNLFHPIIINSLNEKAYDIILNVIGKKPIDILIHNNVSLSDFSTAITMKLKDNLLKSNKKKVILTSGSSNIIKTNNVNRNANIRSFTFDSKIIAFANYLNSEGISFLIFNPTVELPKRDLKNSIVIERASYGSISLRKNVPIYEEGSLHW